MPGSLGKTLRRYIGREIAFGFVAGVAIFTFLLLTARVLEWVDLVLARGVPLLAVGRVFLLAMPSFLELTMPAAVLLGVLAAFGRLANDGEITAMRAAGIPWQSLLGPVALVGLVVAIATFAVSAFARPWANRRILEAVYEVAKSRAASAVRPGVFNSDFDGIVLYVNGADPASGAFEGILVADERDPEARTVVIAEAGSLVADEPERRIRLHLEDGTSVTERTGAESYDLTSFRSFEVNLDIAEDLARAAGERPSDMPLDRLLATTRATDRGARLEATIEVHRKIAFASAALLLALVGVPFAVPTSRSVYARGFAITIALAFGYYFAFSAAVVGVRRGRLPPEIGLWLPNVALAALTAYAILRLARELPPYPQVGRMRPSRT